jgi:hypothetical protein
MIKLPSISYTIDTSLDDVQILESIQSIVDPDTGKKQYRGQLLGSRFWLCRSPFGLPSWLFATIEGKIYRNHHRGHQIELSGKLSSLMSVVLVIWFGGLLAFTITVFGNQIIARIPEDDAVGEIFKSTLILTAIVAYFYLQTWVDMRFLRQHFIHRLPGSSMLYIGKLSWRDRLKNLVWGRNQKPHRSHRYRQQTPLMTKLSKHNK